MGVVNTTYTFAATDTITSTKMNNIIDDTVMTEAAVLGTTLEVASGKLKVRAQGITSNELAANAITNIQIANGSVTPAKLSTGSPNWDTSGNFNINNGLYVAGGSTIVGEVGVGGNLGVAGYVDCEAVYFGDDAGLLYDSGVGSVSVRYGTSADPKFSTFAANGTLSVGGGIVSSTGLVRAQGFGGTANAGVVYFGNGDNYVYHNGSQFEFKFGASISATLVSSGTIWTSGNDGAGSGLDADLLDGLQPSAANAANTIVRRDGNGDSGFRNINCTSISGSLTGNANTATNLSTTRATWASNGTVSAVVGQLSWNNYGNNHTIFDASQSITPSGTACNNTNSDVGWSALLPTLMGWNGTQTHGVRVDSAKFADSATTATTVSNSAITAAKLDGNQSGTAPIYGARAWVNFSGIGTVGANMTILAGGNVSSVNKTATGVYRVTFTTAMPDANYAAIVGSDANSPHKIGGVVTQAASYVDIAYSQINTSSTRENPDWGQVTIFR